ncbi:MAG: response regulator, partial [Leptolyngbya sp. SIO4C1]|nr:response regulator [Leptolyngbya sp. SIO4C1]
LLLDIMMPGIDGYEVTRRIRQNERLPYIPILLITAHDQSSVVEGLDAGADDFIRKPVDVNELLARVRSLLRLKRSIDEQTYMMQQRDDFVARLTHDLRTPLVAANRVLQLCVQGVFGEASSEVKTALENVVTNNENLLQMANTLLEVYRHEAGQKSLTLSRFSLRELCQELVQELAPLAAQHGLDLRLAVADRDSYSVRADRLEIRRLLTNLVGNAIKFTESGQITIRLQMSEVQQIQIDVEDTGPGISEADQAEIFQWFRPGKHMRSGSGLGLHLSQRIAQMHGGHLSVRSRPGEGSTFSLSLPAGALAAEMATTGSSYHNSPSVERP